MTTILLARHGQASFGAEDYDQLSELGEVQARLLGQHYATTQRRIDAVFSGSLLRQRDSARHFWEAYQPSLATSNTVPILDIATPDNYVLPLFDEFDHEDIFVKSSPNFTTQAQIAAELQQANKPLTRLGELFGIAMQRWHSGDYDEDYIESWPQFSNRAQQALEQLRAQVASSHVEQDSTVLVFTSGGVIAAITAHLLQQGSQTAYQLTKSSVNTGVTSVGLQYLTPQLLSYNEYSHLFAEGKRFVTKH